MNLPNRLRSQAARLALAAALLLTACGGSGDRLSALEQHIYLEPAVVATTLAFDRVAIGFAASCMLTTSGEAWCWGNNSDGLLGAGSTRFCAGGLVPCSFEPLRAEAPRTFTALSVAQLHACGLDAAGLAWCWGFGFGGQLGDGGTANSAAAVAVAGGRSYVQIDAGRASRLSCALDAAGTAWCWGPAGGGALGNGTTDLSLVPVPVTAAAQPFVSVGAGDEHACALDSAGEAWCWGRNGYGKLGRGVSGAVLVPSAVAGAHRFASLAVGGVFNCALDTAGAAWCWGFGPALGDGAGQHRDVPTAVSGGHVFVSLSAGYQHACGLKTDGAAWCWGPATLVGGGDEVERTVPVAVAGGHRFGVLQAGGVATCGITLAGTPMCWGFNAQGSVGQANVAP